jgi:hypothetical protein
MSGENIGDAPTSEALRRARIAHALLEVGCRYFVCAGVNAEMWHDSIDREFAPCGMRCPSKQKRRPIS